MELVELYPATGDLDKAAAVVDELGGPYPINPQVLYTLIRPQFKNVPTAISIDPKYADELWVNDPRATDGEGSQEKQLRQRQIR